MPKFADRLRDLELRVERLESELEINEEEESVSEEEFEDDEESKGYVIVCYRKAGSPANTNTLYLQSFDMKKRKAKWTGDRTFAKLFGQEPAVIDFLEHYAISPPSSNHQKPRAEE